MKQLWEHVEKLIAHPTDLKPPASTEDIKALEKKLGVVLPADLVDSLKTHNGQSQRVHYFGIGIKEHGRDILNSTQYLDTESIAYHWEELDSERDEHEDDVITADKGIKPVWFNPKWVPFAHAAHNGTYFFIDLDPAAGGTKGQVIAYDETTEDKLIKIANSFSQWFTDYTKFFLAHSKSLHNPGVATESANTTTGFTMNLKESQLTLVSLANAAELVNNIAQGVIGNEVADTFGGSPLTRSIIYNLAQTQFQSSITKYVGVK